MKHHFLLLSVLIAALCFSMPGFACSKPESAPVIPDPATAVTAQMVKANNEVRAYVKAMEEYIACAALTSQQQKRELEDLKTYADSFNTTIQTFKAARKGG